MAGKQSGRHSGIHRSIHFLITESGQAGFWEYRFRIGTRDFSGRVQAILGLLAARRVKMKIDRALLKYDVSGEAAADAAAKPDASLEPTPPPPHKVEYPKAVAFTCEACSAVYEAVQIRVPAKGIFRCTVCYWPVHRWDGGHDYSRWRLRGEKPRRS